MNNVAFVGMVGPPFRVLLLLLWGRCKNWLLLCSGFNQFH
ncbi:hypothetical protein BT93_L3853 [Corymbia citriodora subsp. variegata]|uniref:Uncharacterized protein n=1 Tax=Corymbia citriodora subsp. variegata TaxID=360336 RepID=A0A8T0CGS1_CORYI|nr:hypothetical protein BT93_L3853 [Corymbia citriodora subsp. variegata]